MKMMIKLKKNEPIKHNGIYYDLSSYDQAKLWRVYNDNPVLRYLFEIVVDEDEEEFFKNKPEDKTEEEFFNETIEEVVKPKRVRKKK
jgi:hypothetical protein